ncbi:GNAT family N-acetyltransferase [Ectobacillus antri]|jgi:ribosomal-protein-alanine N-acetyltransferase|uniref:GNAT family N-acetyltransferase n=1 Tax=Ectobacillus antri TaxID=2486280 RepID=A0ABT6H4F2_9BACI|nr:GNAT family N-acetyltransferase [Ectobacillus antri]MDG4658061.1 GNAT family N-acetyltransferase [Ectobacillus antri]MDG5753698.1 GNAT family N-acetyltransferase [Ectobacillus antri]
MKTNRLSLRLLTLEDAADVWQHFADPAVTEFMDIEPCKDIETAREIIRFHMMDSGCRYGIYNQIGVFIGTCGFHYLRQSKHKHITAEIGFDLAKAYWGNGYMNEAVQALIQSGFTELGYHTIDATVEPGNSRSIRLLEKLGFERAEEMQEGLVYFQLKRDKWLKRVAK